MNIKRVVRFTIIISAFLIALTAFSVIGYAESIDGFEFTLSQNGATITGYEDSQAVDLIIPEKLGDYTVVGIGYNVCWGMWNLECIEIPKTVGVIEDGAFISCTSLQEIIVDDRNANYCDIDGNLFTKDGKTLVLYAIGKSELTYQIPDNVQKIGYEAFAYSKLTNIYMPDTLENIGYSAFYHCDALTDITIPESVKTIEKGAFDYCTQLESVKLPEEITVINAEVFRYCSSLKSMTLPRNISKIGNGAFYQCTSLEKIALPDSVETIGDYAFYYCSSLTDILISQRLNSVGYGAFYGCDNLENVYYHNSSESWSKITVAYDNSNLISAAKIYNYIPTMLSEYKHSDQKIAVDITVPFVYMPVNSKIIVGYYEDELLKTAKVREVSQEDSIVSISIPYQTIDEIRVFLWEGFDTLKAITLSEKISLN